MELHWLMKEFAGLGHVMIGFGPKHLDDPHPELQADIDEFLRRYPFAAKDQDYVEFLETYSAAVVEWPKEELLIILYGFSEFTENLLHPDESLIEREHFFRFAEVIVNLGEKDEDKIGLDFYWDVTGEQRPGIYRCITPWGADWTTTPITWYCDDFLTWLDNLIKHKGRLF